jgi:hypothetical protein
MANGSAAGSVAQRHPRGIFRDRGAPDDGTVVLKVYGSNGRRLARVEIATEAFDDDTLNEMLAWLDRVDPVRRLRLATILPWLAPALLHVAPFLGAA